MKKLNKTIIIAEAGVNHNGSIKIAKKLIDIADKAKADYVKFQTFTASEVLSKNSPKAEYQALNTPKNETAIEMGKKYELSINQHLELKNYCKNKNVKYLTTFHDLKNLKHFKKFNLDFVKIASGDLNNTPFLKQCAMLKTPIILSTGMSTLNEVSNAIKILKKNGKNLSITLLHCNTDYPTSMHDVNLNVLKTFSKKYKLRVGYSDHTSGYEVSLAAVALGAKVIEKHFTVNQKMIGPDHKASLNPAELEELVLKIRNIEIALGSHLKKPTKSELKNKNIVRKSICAIKKIKKNDIFSLKNIGVKRPGNGISPELFFKIIGKKASRDYIIDDFIKEKVK